MKKSIIIITTLLIISLSFGLIGLIKENKREDQKVINDNVPIKNNDNDNNELLNEDEEPDYNEIQIIDSSVNISEIFEITIPKQFKKVELFNSSYHLEYNYRSGENSFSDCDVSLYSLQDYHSAEKYIDLAIVNNDPTEIKKLEKIVINNIT